MRRNIIILMMTMVVVSLGFPIGSTAAEPSNSQYTCVPVFQVTATQPAILIMLDNSGSMNEAAYASKPYNQDISYYGYFEPNVKYSYASNLFTRNTSGAWDGNFLNWAAMRRIDVARKVLTGGKCISRDGGGKQALEGESPAVTRDVSIDNGQVDIWSATPYPNQRFKFTLTKGSLVFSRLSGGVWSSTTYTIKVQKDNTFPDEEFNFVDGNLAGIIEKVGAKAEWGLEFFRYGTGTNQSGGRIVNAIDELNTQSMEIDIQNQDAETWTPLSEAYYVAMQYFKQEDVDTTLDYKAGDSTGQDPWEDIHNGKSTMIPCAKAFVILLTDGASTMDQLVPNYLKNYADSFDSAALKTLLSTYTPVNSGSDYLKDIALYARKNDLRADLEGDQNMILYPIFAFADTSTNDGKFAELLLQEAAKNGGYTERDNVDGPSKQEEWDFDGNGVPDTYYRADNGWELERELLKAINAILERAASGTAVSVLSTSGEGDGTLTQAFFKPTITDGYYDIQWTGYLQTTWIDSHGNMREDTVADKILNPAEDDIIVHYFDEAAGETKVRRYYASAGDPYPEINETTPPDEILGLNEVKGLWEAGSILAQRDPADRTIYTFIDKDQNGTDEMVKFDNTNATTLAALTPYLGVRSSVSWKYLNTPTITTERDRATNLVKYVRGYDMSWFRRRSMDYDGDGDKEAWKLGDIVNSTPVTVSMPSENFHYIYSDESYFEFYKSMIGRETMVYVGANDGMLHAFTSGVYDSTTRSFSTKASTTEEIGDELWAYVPKNLLPHLKWLPSEEYAHVYYIDAKPRVFSAKIFPDVNGDGEPDWGTVLVVGFNLGGGTISVKADFNLDGDDNDAGDTRSFNPAYVAINVTDPRNPVVMWEKSYGSLQMTTSVPAVVKVGEKWLLAFGSGPATCDCEDSTTSAGHVYLVDLTTGNPYKNGTNDWRFVTPEARATMSSPGALDKGLNYNVDAIYFGESYFTSSGDLRGKIYKVVVPYTGDMAYYGMDVSKYDSSPANWTMHEIFNIDEPITVEPTMSTGVNDNVWVYFGTGRYLNNDDKLDTDNQYLVGFKDPFFNKQHGDNTTFYKDDLYHNYTKSAAVSLDLTDLLNSDDYTVVTGGEGTVTGGLLTGTDNTFNDLIDLVHEFDTGKYAAIGKDGWYTTMTGGERIVVSPTVFAGTVFAPSFLPDSDVCGFGGTSMLFGLYYETGTAYYEDIFVDGGKKIDLGQGKGSEIEIQYGKDDQDRTVRTYIQKSTGEIDVREATTALGYKSGLKYWNEK